MKISKNSIAVVATFAFGSLLSVNGNNLRVTNEGYEDPALDVRSDGERKLSYTPRPDDFEDKVDYLEEETKGIKKELKKVDEKQQKTGKLTTEDAHVKASLEKELMVAKEKLSQAEKDEDAEEKRYNDAFMGKGDDTEEDHGRSLASGPQSCSEDKMVRIEKFIIKGDDDGGAEGEHRLRLQGQYYFPNKESDCKQDPENYCAWREGQTHSLHQKGPWVKVQAFEDLQAGTEEHDSWSANDSYTASLTKEQWYRDTCSQYQIKVSTEFKAETSQTSCTSVSAGASGEYGGAGGKVGFETKRCSAWVDPPESYIWVLSVVPFRGQPENPTKKK